MYIFALVTRPNAIIDVSIAVPPYDMIGIGTPTTGNSPVTMPILIAIYTKKLNETPKHNNLPKVDLEDLK